jgi:hypothetical protein
VSIREFKKIQTGVIISQTEKKPKTICPIMYRGRQFQSIREAIKQEGVSRTHFRRLLTDPSILDVYELTNEILPYGHIPVFGKKDDGPSVLFQRMHVFLQDMLQIIKIYEEKENEMNPEGNRLIETVKGNLCVFLIFYNQVKYLMKYIPNNKIIREHKFYLNIIARSISITSVYFPCS